MATRFILSECDDGVDHGNDNCMIREMLSERVKHIDDGGYVAAAATVT